MSFFKKIFGGKSFADSRAEADALFEQSRWGEAKLAYDRAIERAKEAPEADLAHARARAATCADELAKERIAAAEEYLAHGDEELARSELEHAIETAASTDLRRRAERRVEELERRDARERAKDDAAVTDEERFAALAGGWDEDQAEEYELYGDRFREALLAMQAERVKEAHTLLEAVLADTDDPHYLWLEVGRARLLDGDTPGGTEALESFLASIGPDEGGNSRLAAHLELARLADEREDVEAAMEQYEAAIAADDENAATYLALGHYLRVRGQPAEAIEVLDAGLPFIGEVRPDWRVIQELALAHQELGHDDQAVDLLEEVIQIHVARSARDFPPETAVPLARLHEKAGRVERAADLFRSLADGSDRANHYAYHREAARVLDLLGLHAEARRMLLRASELAPDDDARTAESALIEKLAE